MRKKIIILSILTAAVIMALIFIMNFTTFGKTPSIGMYRTTPEQNTHLLEILKNSESGFGKEFDIIVYNPEKDLLEQFRDSPADLLLSENFHLTVPWDTILAPLKPELINRYPRSTRDFIQYKNTPYLLPLQLDHIELAYNKNRIKSESASNDIIFSFNDFELQLLSLAGKEHYPLMISGAENRDLLDTLSVLTLSMTGVEGYKKLQNLFKSDKPFSQIIQDDLRGEISFGDVLTKLTDWKNKGIIHPEWLRFTQEDVISFLKNDLSSAYIMRLSTHRTMPESLLQKLKESPFPFFETEDRATGLVMPGYSLAVSGNSPFRKKAASVFSGILSNDNQNRLSSYSGLAPATSMAEALDKQSSNVRLWGAATQHIQVPLSDTDSELIIDLRNYLSFN